MWSCIVFVFNVTFLNHFSHYFNVQSLSTILLKETPWGAYIKIHTFCPDVISYLAFYLESVSHAYSEIILYLAKNGVSFQVVH